MRRDAADARPCHRRRRHPQPRGARLGRRRRGLRVEAPGAGLAERLAGLQVDWLLSIANLSLIPAAVLALATQGAVNFHDGPLPRYAGLNAPVWAILNGEAQHGITWHLIAGGIDEGDILEQRLFDIARHRDRPDPEHPLLRSRDRQLP